MSESATSSAQDAFRRLEERLEQASEAAERLVAEASSRIAGTKTPPAGWQTADQTRRTSSTRVGGELEQVLHLLGAVRDLVPPELQQRLIEALRQLLLAVRALLDWYLERLEQRRQTPVEVQDIPVL
jgi:hypothetical protein